MSYQVLARKWRPQSFKEMVGQEHVLKALIHSLDQKRLHHAYLFTGTRGVGKTTIGRILAKCLNCETGITSVPCGQCDACREITEGRFVDLIEIDAASRTKVEDMRELLDNVQYSPTRGRFKVYLIDEVHMLSQSSFNALLKTLEEPPEHVKFLFATTDPQKLPVTILSRCLQFNLKNMPPERIVGHLKNVLGQENIGYEESALWLLARSADGSMRDALSLTDQAIAYGNHKLAEHEVSAMLGSIDQKQVYRIIEAVANSNAGSVLQEVAALAEYSPDYSAVLANVISVLHRVAIEQAVPGSTDNSMGDQLQIVELAKGLSAEDVQLFYQVALVGRSDLPISPDQRAGLEMVLLRMLAFQPNIDKNIPKLQLTTSEKAGRVETDCVETDRVETSSAVIESDSETHESGTNSNVEEPASNDNIPLHNVETQEAPASKNIEAPPPWDMDSPTDMTAVDVDRSQIPPEGHPALSDTHNSDVAYDESYMQAQSDEGELFVDQMAQGDSLSAQKKTADIIEDKKSSTGLNDEPSVQNGGGSGLDSELKTGDASTQSVDRPEAGSAVSEVSALNPSVSEETDFEGAGSKEIIDVSPELIGSNQIEAADKSVTTNIVSSDEASPESNDIHSFLSMDNPWPHILPALNLTGMTQNLAANTSLKLEQNRAELCAAEGNFRLLTDIHKSRISQGFKHLFGETFQVDFSLGRSELETPAEWKGRKKEERLALAVSSIETDPNVVTLVKTFDATILTETVEPLD